MIQLSDITNYLEQIAPLRFQEGYDNSGLLVGQSGLEITGAIISLDATEEVIDEAISKQCNLVISHHPIIFKGIKKINSDFYVDRAIIKAIKNDIAIYAIHTNLDNVLRQGVNEKIAHKIGLQNVSVLRPHPSAPLEASYQLGAGAIGSLQAPVSEDQFLLHLKSKMRLNMIKHTALLGRQIVKVAVCGGTGSFLLSHAKEAGADIFITADFKYHEFFDANHEIIIADIGHYESEYFTIELLIELLSKKFPKFAAHYTNVVTNPVYYF